MVVSADANWSAQPHLLTASITISLSGWLAITVKLATAPPNTPAASHVWDSHPWKRLISLSFLPKTVDFDFSVTKILIRPNEFPNKAFLGTCSTGLQLCEAGRGGHVEWGGTRSFPAWACSHICIYVHIHDLCIVTHAYIYTYVYIYIYIYIYTHTIYIYIYIYIYMWQGWSVGCPNCWFDTALGYLTKMFALWQTKDVACIYSRLPQYNDIMSFNATTPGHTWEPPGLSHRNSSGADSSAAPSSL